MRADSPRYPGWSACARSHDGISVSTARPACGVIRNCSAYLSGNYLPLNPSSAFAPTKPCSSEGALAQADAAVLDEVERSCGGVSRYPRSPWCSPSTLPMPGFRRCAFLGAGRTPPSMAPYGAGVHIANLCRIVWNGTGSLDLDRSPPRHQRVPGRSASSPCCPSSFPTGCARSILAKLAGA